MPRGTRTDTDGTADSTTTSRRRVLRAVGAGATVALGASGTTGAARTPAPGLSPARRAVRDEYASTAAVRAALDDHAADVLAGLADRGVLDRGDLAEFDLSVLDGATFARSSDGVHVSAFELDGVVTAHVVAGTETPTHDVSVVVQPERGRSFARVVSKADGERTLLLAGDDGVVEPDHHCWYETRCSSECCTSTCADPAEYEYHCCEQSDGTTNCEPVERVGCCRNCC